jgi:type II secretory pathway component PulK
MRRRSRFQHGSALLLVFWALLVMTAATLGWALLVHQGIQTQGERSRGIEARSMAHSGLAVALHPLVSLKTPGLEKEILPGMRYRVKILSEGGRLNVNWLLRGEEPQKLAILKQWLALRGLDLHQREVLMDCLLDWVDADSVRRLNGAEDEGDYHAPNRELLSVEEIAQVRGSSPLVSQPDWQDDLTIYSQGPIDLAAAPARILELIPGIGETRIARFVQYRRGPDGIDGTADDVEFANEGELQAALGLTAEQYQEISGLVTFRDPTMHITSEGHSGDVDRKVEVVVRKGNGNAQILSWKE